MHIDRNEVFVGPELERMLGDILKRKAVDLLLIAGDISNHYLKTHDFIRKLEQVSQIPVLFVPGNHDYWSRDHSVKDTNRIADFFNRQSYSLAGQPRVLTDCFAVVGTPGWYDYGYADHSIYSQQDFEKKQYGFASWNDRHYVNWGRSDQTVSQEMLEQLHKDLQSVQHRRIILMTHVATHKAFVMPLPHRVYNYANAFLGAKAYEALYEQYSAIDYSIMGHVHFRKVLRDEQRTYISACVGNHKHWRIKDIGTQIENSLLTFDIG
ncbi:putative phosphohydrolase [Alkalibacterium sp. AK22]|nr:putative phosphohydrolase [Alkalibacterium sp. AK22]